MSERFSETYQQQQQQFIQVFPFLYMVLPDNNKKKKKVQKEIHCTLLYQG